MVGSRALDQGFDNVHSTPSAAQSFGSGPKFGGNVPNHLGIRGAAPATVSQHRICGQPCSNPLADVIQDRKYPNSAVYHKAFMPRLLNFPIPCFPISYSLGKLRATDNLVEVLPCDLPSAAQYPIFVNNDRQADITNVPALTTFPSYRREPASLPGIVPQLRARNKPIAAQKPNPSR